MIKYLSEISKRKTRKQKLLERKKDKKGIELGEEEEFLNTWASCNITGERAVLDR